MHRAAGGPFKAVERGQKCERNSCSLTNMGFVSMAMPTPMLNWGNRTRNERERGRKLGGDETIDLRQNNDVSSQ